VSEEEEEHRGAKKLTADSKCKHFSCQSLLYSLCIQHLSVQTGGCENLSTKETTFAITDINCFSLLIILTSSNDLYPLYA
jgi:hypothetical protein